MHYSWDENYERGYEWWMMKEAKKVRQMLANLCLCFYCLFVFYFRKLKILQNFHMFLVMNALFITETQKISYNCLEASNVFIFRFERMSIIYIYILSQRFVNTP